MITIVYDHLTGEPVDRATFWPPSAANAWDGNWHSLGEGHFIRYERTVWGGGYFQHAVPKA
jgi:hypothetical protein